MTDYKKAIELNPNFTRAYISRGILETKRLDWREAKADFDKAVDFDPDSAFAYCCRGWFNAKKGNLNEALDDYRKAIVLNPNYAEPYYFRGLVQKQAGDLEAALADFRKALKIKPDYSDAKTAIADCAKAAVSSQPVLDFYTMATDSKKNTKEIWKPTDKDTVVKWTDFRNGYSITNLQLDYRSDSSPQNYH